MTQASQTTETTSGGLTLRELRAQAIAEHQAGNLDAAKPAYRRCLLHNPADAAVWSNLGALHRREKDYDTAVACQRRAIEIAPDSIDYLVNLGNALYDAEVLEESVEVRKRAARLRPEDPVLWQYVAMSLRGLNRYREAIDVCVRGLALDPHHVELRIQKSLAELALGDYPTGFTSFEARWDGDEISKPTLSEPEWDGSDPAGKRLMVVPEQGFGDTILMARLLPALKARGAWVCLACKPALARLFEGLPGLDHLGMIGGPKPGLDAWVSMMSLPRHLGTTLDTVPEPARLSVPDAARRRAAAIVAPFRNRFRIGVLWSGSVSYRANHKRSFGQQRFLQLAQIPGVQLFSLYKGPLLNEFRKSGLASLVVDAAGNDQDFADTAALIEELDLVVSMDSAVVHLAGSLGAPVWNLLHFAPYWLYGSSETRTPWYPTMRLVRQPSPGDWDSVFDQIEADIRARTR